VAAWLIANIGAPVTGTVTPHAHPVVLIAPNVSPRGGVLDPGLGAL
jgi:hypothetical protein